MMDHDEMIKYFQEEQKKIEKQQAKNTIIKGILYIIFLPIMFIIILMICLGFKKEWLKNEKIFL